MTSTLTVIEEGTYELPNGDSLLVEKPSAYWERNANRVTVWRMREGSAIAYVKFLPAFGYCVSAVEVKSEYRGNGLARQTYKDIQSVFGIQLTSSGHYTPEGFRSLKGVLPFQDENELDTDQNTGYPSYCSMNFVTNWNERLTG